MIIAHIHLAFSPKFHTIYIVIYVVRLSDLMGAEEKHELEMKIKNNGGTYNADMEYGVVTHLVAQAPEGQKYKAALDWGVFVVDPKWISSSINFQGKRKDYWWSAYL